MLGILPPPLNDSAGRTAHRSSPRGFELWRRWFVGREHAKWAGGGGGSGGGGGGGGVMLIRLNAVDRAVAVGCIFRGSRSNVGVPVNVGRLGGGPRWLSVLSSGAGTGIGGLVYWSGGVRDAVARSSAGW